MRIGEHLLRVPTAALISARRFAASLVLLGAAGAALVLTGPSFAHASREAVGPATMVQLTTAGQRTEAVALRRAGAQQVDASLRLWRLEPDVAAVTLDHLRSRNAVVFAQKERTYGVAAVSDTPDPLQGQEWWLGQIGVSGLTPPGPGVPVTIVDSGIDLQHPELSGRADTITLNAQEPAPLGGEHGTSVASVIGAPVNGVGLVGVYPRVVLRSWDAAQGDGTQLESTAISEGILAAARAGRSVINLSLGSDASDLSIELAVSEAVASGSLVVAASGNDGDRGSPLGYPAAYPHVTTVGATDQTGGVASFSSRSNYVDLAAPGDNIIVASALGNDWRAASGTSFSSPMVAAAAAWVWTARPDLTAGQVAEILRRSATDIAPAGRDQSSGFGMLNVAAALALPAPIRDPYEPNDDIDEVDPNGNRYESRQPALTTSTKRTGRIAGRVDRYEDPSDVFRMWLPASARITATLTANTDGDLALYSTAARSVVGRFATEGRLGAAATKGTRERLVYTNKGKGRWAYLSVKPAANSLDATYSLAVSSATVSLASRKR
jgi:Subtilase family